MTPADACSTFQRIAVKTWNMLREARNVDYQLGEETVTDCMVLQLKQSQGLEVITRTFSKADEGKNGADWEWWLTGPNGGWFGFRVQAKILDFQSDRFEHLHYQGKKDKTFQSDKLLRNALRSKVPLAPIYCLYANWDVARPLDLFSCKGTNIRRPPFGCSVMSAFDVRSLRRNGGHRELDRVIPRTYPLHCLACCSSEQFVDLPDRARSFWKTEIVAKELPGVDGDFDEGGLEPDELSELLETYNGLTVAEDPPSHVKLLESGELVEGPDRDLGGIALVREVGSQTT